MEKKEISLNNIKGLRLSRTNIVIFLIAVFAIISNIIGIYFTYENYNKMTASYDQYNEAVQAIMEFESASDYLTDQVREFMITHDTTYVQNYFAEINVTKTREHALETLKDNTYGTDVIIADLSLALEESNQLTDAEIHAMKLIVAVEGYTEDSVTTEVWEYELTAEEKEYTEEEAQDAAYLLVFGEDYQNAKTSIIDNSEKAQTALNEVKKATEEEHSGKMGSSLRVLAVQTALLYILIIVIFGLVNFLVIHPIFGFVKSSRKDERLNETVGAREVRYLACAFNEINDISRRNTRRLEMQAECDALTGVLNRRAYDVLSEDLKNTDHPLTYIMIDVDHFKDVNDNFGHNIGDQLLKHVATLLKKVFRNDDYVIRYGGDEFVIMMTDVDASNIAPICTKIDDINKELAHPEDGLPTVSISAGIAFSEHGFSAKLAQDADAALYEAKEKGRCRYCMKE